MNSALICKRKTYQGNLFLTTSLYKLSIYSENVEKTSRSASNVAKWLEGLIKYHENLKVIKPKIERKKEIQKLLTRTIVELHNLQEEEANIRHAGLQTHFDGQDKHIVNYVLQDDEGKFRQVRDEIQVEIDNQPNTNRNLDDYLAPEDGEEPGRSNLQNESLYFISNEIKKKDQSKKFVLWEQTELRNHWDDKSTKYQTERAYERTNNHHWTHEPSNQSVSVIDSQKTKGKANPPNLPPETGDSFATLPKKDRQLNNVFLQSQYQERIEKKKAPWSHNALNKNQKAKKYDIQGRPLFEGLGNHVQNITAGRSRIFYSSNVF